MSIVHNIQIPNSCPDCSGSSVAYILYGLPDFQAIEEDIESGKVCLGGCVLFEESPQWRCATCSHEWGELLEIEEMIEIRLRNERRKKEKESEALARGVMEAFVNEHGSVRCPYCNVSFRVKYGLTIDGAHASCGTYLSIELKL